MPELAPGHGGAPTPMPLRTTPTLNLLFARSAAPPAPCTHPQRRGGVLRSTAGQLNGAVIAAEPDGARQRPARGWW